MADNPKKQGVLITMWKKYTIKLVQRRFGYSVNPKLVEEYLDREISSRIKVPKCYWVNNYRKAVIQTDLLAVIESIWQNCFIIGGAAVTYLQHAVCKNPFRDFILMLRLKRNAQKQERKKYDRVKEKSDWNRWNRKQNNTKIISNSLYGVLGYAKFIFYNVFLAESITRMGRTIIADAATGFEDFLCDNVCIATDSEMYEYVSRIIDDYEEKYSNVDFGAFGDEVTVDRVIERLRKKCGYNLGVFNINERHLRGILEKLPKGALFLLYYRNNFMEFNRLKPIRDRIVSLITKIPELKLPEIKDIAKRYGEDVANEVNELWALYEMCVYNCHPIYDNVRKMAYGTRKAVLYIDTDSNFISLARWVKQIQNEFMGGQFPQKDFREYVFVASNILTLFLSEVVDKNLKDFARRCNIKEEWLQYLSMKNEFFFWRILFSDVKKRYIDLQLIQEGKLLKDGMGIPEIKGYDFRKFQTKAPVRDYYTQMCLDGILRPDEINLSRLLGDCDRLKRTIRDSMLRGEATYLKQSNVSSPEHYVDPFRMPGIKGVLLWNALMPDQSIELPAEVDLIPIKNLSARKYKEWFAEAFPEQYERLNVEIFQNRNPAIANMQLNVIAKPRIDGLEMPEWLMAAMDTSKVVNSTIKLIHPIMEALGCRVNRPTKTKEFLTNMVDL